MYVNVHCVCVNVQADICGVYTAGSWRRLGPATVQQVLGQRQFRDQEVLASHQRVATAGMVRIQPLTPFILFKNSNTRGD